MELQCKEISKNYGTFKAIKELSLTLTPGIWGLLGPNGSGKTTLLRMIVGNIKPSQGNILWNGENIEKSMEEYLGHIGYLPQNFGVDKNFTVYSFLWYMGLLKGIKKEILTGRISILLEQFSLQDVSKKKVSKLSGGMKRRVGICQALLNDPKILIVDEPTAGLDIEERRKFRRYLSELGKDKIIILSTHIVSDVEFIANQFIFLKEGEMVLLGSAGDLIHTLDGKVFEGVVSPEISIPSSHIVNERIEAGGKRVLRFLNEEHLPETHFVEPSLGDLYLSLYGEEEY